MELDDGVEVLLKPGDVVVNCGTRHGWRNKGTQSCIGAFVCIGAQRGAEAEEIVKDHLAAYNSHNVDKMASFWTEDVVLDDVGLGVIIRGKQEVKSYVCDAFAAIPDEKKELKSLFCTGNRAVCEMVDTGTQTGAFEKLPATGKSYSLRAVWVIEMREGKICRLASYYDVLSFLQQIGLMPKSPLEIIC